MSAVAIQCMRPAAIPYNGPTIVATARQGTAAPTPPRPCMQATPANLSSRHGVFTACLGNRPAAPAATTMAAMQRSPSASSSSVTLPPAAAVLRVMSASSVGGSMSLLPPRGPVRCSSPVRQRLQGSGDDMVAPMSARRLVAAAPCTQAGSHRQLPGQLQGSSHGHSGSAAFLQAHGSQRCFVQADVGALSPAASGATLTSASAQGSRAALASASGGQPMFARSNSEEALLKLYRERRSQLEENRGAVESADSKPAQVAAGKHAMDLERRGGGIAAEHFSSPWQYMWSRFATRKPEGQPKPCPDGLPIDRLASMVREYLVSYFGALEIACVQAAMGLCLCTEAQVDEHIEQYFTESVAEQGNSMTAFEMLRAASPLMLRHALPPVRLSRTHFQAVVPDLLCMAGLQFGRHEAIRLHTFLSNLDHGSGLANLTQLSDFQGDVMSCGQSTADENASQAQPPRPSSTQRGGRFYAVGCHPPQSSDAGPQDHPAVSSSLGGTPHGSPRFLEKQAALLLGSSSLTPRHGIRRMASISGPVSGKAAGRKADARHPTACKARARPWHTQITREKSQPVVTAEDEEMNVTMPEVQGGLRLRSVSPRGGAGRQSPPCSRGCGEDPDGSVDLVSDGSQLGSIRMPSQHFVPEAGASRRPSRSPSRRGASKDPCKTGSPSLPPRAVVNPRPASVRRASPVGSCKDHTGMSGQNSLQSLLAFAEEVKTLNTHKELPSQGSSTTADSSDTDAGERSRFCEESAVAPKAVIANFVPAAGCRAL
eukprot:TRINITY_DN7243_c0_g1_i4.p1 TRINITY_DN7243_c0_g1~~TRINITY_DN7243_c0_g1_i4.p1  ORF type:complete len:769 (+),score=108.39 TRINITY_DN7243_c0_g1_i4:184-2490(+)